MTRGIAIRVAFHGPTTYRGARWIATADLPRPMHRVIVSYDYAARQGIENAQHAADEIVARWNADYTERYAVDGPYRILAGGHLADGSYAFIAGA